MNKSTFLLLALCLFPNFISCTGGVHDVNVNPSMPGGIHNDYMDRFDAQNNEEDALALRTVVHHIENNLSVDGYIYEEILSLTVQLVAGKKYTFTISYKNLNDDRRYFEVTVWVKIWENFAQITKALEIHNDNTIPSEPKLKMHGEPVARELDIMNNPSDARIYAAVISELERAHQLKETGFVFKKTSNVSTQLVAGTIYNFDITFVNEVSKQERTFTAKAIIIPWQNVCDVLSVVEKEEVSENIYGGFAPYEFDFENKPSDQLIFDEVHTLAMAQLGGDKARWQFIEIRNAKQQLVAGTIYDFEVVYGDADANELVFHANVYYVPWTGVIMVNSLKINGSIDEVTSDHN